MQFCVAPANPAFIPSQCRFVSRPLPCRVPLHRLHRVRGPQPIVVDLAWAGTSKWIGSATLPGLDIKGTPLSAISVSDGVVGSDAAMVLYGVLNGTLEARDRASGSLLWEYQTEASRRNVGWVLTSERKFNSPLLFHSAWREAPLVGADRQFGVGSIFSSPLVVGGVVYFGSSDGYVYAIE